jgi:PAS domain-containing protein
MGMAEISAAIGVTLVTIAAIVLIWVVSLRNIQEQTAEVRDRAERMVTAQAATLAEEVRHELQLVDQSLSILQDAWNRDEEHFDLLAFQKLTPALTSVANDIFIADEKRVVRQNIMPQAIGQGIGGPYLNFPHGTLELLTKDGQQTKTGQLIIGDTGGAIEARRYLMYIVRPLAKPTKWLIGASFRTEELIKLYNQVSIGINGTVALMDSQRGTLQAIAGPAARRPQIELSKSDMLAAFKTKVVGTWTGPTAMDNVIRIHGFAKVTGREMYVTVAIAQSEAMAAADTNGSGAWWVGFTASVVVVSVGGLILWEIFNLRANRRRQRAFTRAQSDLESMQTEIGMIRGRSAIAARRVSTLLRNAPDGMALLDADLRLVAWNQLFAAECGVAPEMLREEMPVDELFRQQAHAGLIGSLRSDAPDAIEAEIAQRVAILRTEPAGAVLPQLDASGRAVALYVDVVPDGGGLILLIGEVETEI